MTSTSNREIFQVVVPEALLGLRAEVQKVATADRLTVSAWCLRAILAAAKREMPPATARRRKKADDTGSYDW